MEPQARKTEILRVDPEEPEEAFISWGALVLREGGLVAFPTETVYGLGANALDEHAVSAIFIAKGRPSSNPLIVHVPDVEAALQVAAEWPDLAQKLAERFWPGPLTLALPKRPHLPDIVTGGGATVGVRVPAHPVARALLRAAGVPVAAPSANRSTEVSPTLAAHVIASLSGSIDLILDAGPTSGGVESSVLDLTTHPPTLLRPGLITPAEIEAVIGPICRQPEGRSADIKKPMSSPGQMARHYAPRTPLEIGDMQRVYELAVAGERVGWLTFLDEGSVRQMADEFSPDAVTIVPMPLTPESYANRLYAELHRLDRAGMSRIVVEWPPETEAWLAIRDRLRRASAAL